MTSGDNGDVDVECNNPESTHSSAPPPHGYYSSLSNRDGQNNIKDFNEEDAVGTVRTNGNETDKVNDNNARCSVCCFKTGDGKRFVVEDKYVLTSESDEFQVHLTNSKEREDLEVDTRREIQLGQDRNSPTASAERSSLPGKLLDRTVDLTGRTPFEYREDRLIFLGESISNSRSDHRSHPGEQSPYPVPGPQPVLRLTNFSISHILKPNFGKKRLAKESSVFSEDNKDESKANNPHVPVDSSDIR